MVGLGLSDLVLACWWVTPVPCTTTFGSGMSKAGVDLLVSGVGERKTRSCSWLEGPKVSLSLCHIACGYSGCPEAIGAGVYAAEARMVPDMVAVEFACLS